MRGRLLIACTVALVLLVASPALAVSSALVQNVDTSAYPRVVFTLVVSPDAVTAPGEVPPVGVKENGRDVRDVTVSSLIKERQPIDVVLLVDTSGSMKGAPLADAKVAARRFVESMESSDRIAVVAFASEPVLLQSFTSDHAALFATIDGLQAAGETALYDGLVQAASAFVDSAATERYIVALSDGGDTLSLNSPDNAVRAAASAKAPVYAVALESPEYNPATLETIAGVSGGRFTTVSESGSLATVYQSIAEEMQLRYRVEFVSSRPNTPELNLAIAVGDGADAAHSSVTVVNPRFQASAATAVGLEQPHPSFMALGSSLMAIFGATTLLAFAVMLILRRDKAALEQLRFYDQLQAASAEGGSAEDPGTARGALLNTLGGIAERKGFTGLVQRWLDTAGIALRANEYIFFHVLGTIVVGSLAQYLSGGAVLVTLVAVLLAVVLPLGFLRLKTSKRVRDFDNQLPDILDLIAGSLRSGWGIQQSMDLVVSEVGDPASSEFRRAQAEARLGLPLEEALERMSSRVDSADLGWVVAAISIQREVGGNLAEVLNTVSKTIRERAELHRQVQALTAEGRFSLIILAVLPFVLFVLLFLANREFVLIALQSPVGLAAFGMGGLLLLVGIIWLNRVMKIEV